MVCETRAVFHIVIKSFDVGSSTISTISSISLLALDVWPTEEDVSLILQLLSVVDKQFLLRSRNYLIERSNFVAPIAQVGASETEKSELDVSANGDRFEIRAVQSREASRVL